MNLKNLRNKLEPLALTILRVGTGFIMATHGWSKYGNHQFVQFLKDSNIPFPEISAHLAFAGEYLGGLGLIAGLFTPLAAFGVCCSMAVVVFHIHWDNGLMAQNKGYEYPLTLLLISFYFMIRGAGVISLDRIIRWIRKG